MSTGARNIVSIDILHSFASSFDILMHKRGALRLTEAATTHDDFVVPSHIRDRFHGVVVLQVLTIANGGDAHRVVIPARSKPFSVFDQLDVAWAAC